MNISVVPSMNDDGFISGPPLDPSDLLNDVNDGSRISTETIRSPARQLELSHLLHLARLQDREHAVIATIIRQL